MHDNTRIDYTIIDGPSEARRNLVRGETVTQPELFQGGSIL